MSSYGYIYFIKDFNKVMTWLLCEHSSFSRLFLPRGSTINCFLWIPITYLRGNTAVVRDSTFYLQLVDLG